MSQCDCASSFGGTVTLHLRGARCYDGSVDAQSTRLIMMAQVFTYQNLPVSFKSMMENTLMNDQIVYVIKNNDGTPKTITTSVTQAIQKVQKKCQ